MMHVAIQYLISIISVFVLVIVTQKLLRSYLPSIARRKYLSVLFSALTIVAIMQALVIPISNLNAKSMKSENTLPTTSKIKRVILAHAWPADATTAWYPNLKERLTEIGIELLIPALPHPEESTAQDWVQALKAAGQDNPSETLLIGHSIGGTALLRMLESTDQQYAGLIMVSTAGFDLGYPALKDFFEGEINYGKVQNNVPYVTTLYSPNDQVLAPDPMKHAHVFLSQLDAKTIVLNNRGHFAPFDNCTEIPELLEEIGIRH